MRPITRWLILVWFLTGSICPGFSQELRGSERAVNSLFRDQFYLPPAQKIRYNTFQADGFLLLERPTPGWNSGIAVVSSFAPQALRTRVLKNLHSVDEAKEWIQAEKKSHSFEGVQIVELALPLRDGGAERAFWVGNKSFDSLARAAAEIAMVHSLIELQGGDFARALALAEEFVEPEPLPPVQEVKARAQFQKEEQIALRWIDQLEIGEKLYGPFMGTPAGEPILYQSFGETSWRSTNLAERSFRSQVGYWTHRLVFKGIWFPINTVDPFVELTGALESSPNDGGSQLDTSVGVEWRPLERNAFLENFRPGGIPLLKWVKNYRFFLQYFDRRNLKDEIANIDDFDFRFGVSIFYEWGIDLPPMDQGQIPGFGGLLQRYVWGEYFGEYGWRDTNFTSEENFDAWLLDSSVILGVKTPAVRFPLNPLNPNLVLMPYLRFALTQNMRLSNPLDNKYFIAVGIRWMPFRDYTFQNNEWLFKTKVFAEWLGIGKVQFLKQDNTRPLPDEDWRIGVAFSLRRF